ncbi:MAG: hypothetical protein LRY55_08720 [Leadbetterella sp.]|nr:hypothetical protein [Leadbetterella sp.]
MHEVSSGTRIGKLRAIYESTGQDLFAIEAEDKEVLVPIVDDFIHRIDHENQKIEVKLPEGLLDVYMNP